VSPVPSAKETWRDGSISASCFPVFTFRRNIGDPAVDLAGSAVQRELELAVGTPPHIVALIKHVFEESLEVTTATRSAIQCLDICSSGVVQTL